MQLPPCGLYRTTAPIGSIEAGRLVYFHNHGDPGPGVYLPKGWKLNRVEFEEKCQALGDPGIVKHLQPLPPEGFYAVVEPFHCCEQKCMRFEKDALLQVGYNGDAEPIIFVPELVDSMLAMPAKGWKTSLDAIGALRHLKVPTGNKPSGPSQ